MKIVKPLLLSFLLLALPAVVQAQFTFTTNNGAITITGYSGSDGTVVIPDIIDGLPVRSIGSGVFAYKGGVTNVIIPDEVTNIGVSVFEYCVNLTSINLPAGVTQIPDFAFRHCDHLSNAPISGSVTDIGNFAFSQCGSLTSIFIPEGVFSIGSAAFANCDNLTNAVIPASVTSLGSEIFNYSLQLPGIVVHPENLFYCSVDGVLFNKSRTILLECPTGRSGNYVVPSGTTKIAGSAFQSCPALTTVTIPASVTNLGYYAFYACGSLTGIYFQGNPPDLVFGPFDNDKLTIYYLPGTTGWGPTFGGMPTVLWNPQAQTSDASFGVRTNGFGFNIIGTADIPVVVEASTNLAGSWIPLQSASLTNGLFYFSDPQWTNHPGRFYRIRSP